MGLSPNNEDKKAGRMGRHFPSLESPHCSSFSLFFSLSRLIDGFDGRVGIGGFPCMTSMLPPPLSPLNGLLPSFIKIVLVQSFTSSFHLAFSF